MKTKLKFEKKVTAGVYEAEILNNRKYSHIRNVGALPQAVFDALHKNHDAGGVSGNFLLFSHDGEYTVCSLTTAEKLIAKYEL